MKPPGGCASAASAARRNLWHGWMLGTMQRSPNHIFASSPEHTRAFWTDANTCTKSEVVTNHDYYNFGRLLLAPATPPEAMAEDPQPETGKGGGSMPTCPRAVARAPAARCAGLILKELDRSLRAGCRLGAWPRGVAPWRIGSCCAPPPAAVHGSSWMRIGRQQDPNNSATGTRTRVARVRAEYPNQLDYSGCCIDFSYGRMQQLHSRHIAASAGFLLFWLASFLGAPPDAYVWHGAKASLSHICLRSWATLRHAWTVASTSCRSYQ